MAGSFLVSTTAGPLAGRAARAATAFGRHRGFFVHAGHSQNQLARFTFAGDDDFAVFAAFERGFQAVEPQAGAVYADITWMAFIGERPAAEHVKVWELVRDARDVGVRTVTEAHAGRRRIEGWQVDRAVRDFVAAAGHAEHFLHRTGHSIGGSVHGDGANIDDYETHDTRELVSGLAFSIEPGVYLQGRFGVRSELDVFLSDAGPQVYTPPQRELVKLV